MSVSKKVLKSDFPKRLNKAMSVFKKVLRSNCMFLKRFYKVTVCFKKKVLRSNPQLFFRTFLKHSLLFRTFLETHSYFLEPFWKPVTF